MADEIIEELWNIKDGIARDYDYDIDALVAHLTALAPSPGQRVVDLRATRTAAQERPVDTERARRR
jgi:hypothetical protein